MSDAAPDSDAGQDVASEAVSEALRLNGAPTPVCVRLIGASRVSSMITSLVLCVLALVGVILGIGLGGMSSTSAWAVLLVVSWLGFTGGMIFLALWYPAAAYAKLRYAVNDMGIEIRHGIFWRKVVSVPKQRVQHTDVEQGPLMRRFGIAKLVIHTAGTQYATVSLEGLEFDMARRIRDHLIGKRVGSDHAE